MVLTLVMTTGWTSWDTHKPSTQHHRSIHHSPQLPLCQPSTSNSQAPDERMAHRDQHPRLPVQTAEEAVTDIYQGIDSRLCHPLKEEHTGNQFDQYTGNKKFVCKICQNQFKNLLIHLKKSKACQNHYDMDTLQKQAKVKQKSKHTEAQASYRRRQLTEDPITFRHKHAMEQAASRLRNIEKDPVGTRARHARVQAATRLRQLEKDPVGFRAKHARVQAATNKKNLEMDPTGTRAKHAKVQAATRLKNLEKDPVAFRAKHARVQAATRLKNPEKDPTGQEATGQTATGLEASQCKPTEDVKTEQEEMQCSLLPDLDYNDGDNPTEFNISCQVSPVQVPMMGQLKTETKEDYTKYTSNIYTTNSLFNMPSPSPQWFATEDSESKPLLDSALQSSVEQQNPSLYQESQNQPAEAVKTEQEEMPCSTYNLLINRLPQPQQATVAVVPGSAIQLGSPVFGATPDDQVFFKW